MTISTPSSSASSSSQGEALKYARGRRAITLMSFAPSLREERQQSIAVLPTPMIKTFSPIESVWPKAIDSSQSIPMWMRSVSRRPGRSSSLPRGAAHEDRVVAFLEQRAHARDGRVIADIDAKIENRLALFIEHARRQAEG